ncbi:MAG: gamma-glutamylcyclotransferase [Massilia sp.]
MSHDTIAINQQMDTFDGHEQLWLFGYGSLIFKADFPYLDKRPALLPGWQRRFWQGSHDHRGTPEAPGRVLTLAPEAGAVCAGMAYLITPAVFAHLDHREKNGYLRIAAEISFDDEADDAVVGKPATAQALVYIADEDNAAWLGPASEEAIARHIAGAQGPSGPNRDYLLGMARALRELGKVDAHVFAIEAHLAALG